MLNYLYLGKRNFKDLFEKNIFKVITLNKVIKFEKVLNSTQVFNSCLVDEIKDPCIGKTYKKYCPVIHTYNNKKKDNILINSLKILGVSKSINFCLTIII